jgi:hypothetical protein
MRVMAEDDGWENFFYSWSGSTVATFERGARRWPGHPMEPGANAPFREASPGTEFP